MKFKIILFFFILCFSLNSYSQEGFNIIAGLRGSKFVGTEPLGTSNYKLSYTVGALFGTNSLATVGNDLIINLNSGFIFEWNNTEFDGKNHYSFSSFASSMPFYLSIMKKNLFQVGIGGYGDLNTIEPEDNTDRFEDRFFPYDFINLIDVGFYFTAHYMIPNTDLNIFMNYKRSIRKQMRGYQSVGPYGSLSEPFNGFRITGLSLGLGIFILK